MYRKAMTTCNDTFWSKRICIFWSHNFQVIALQSFTEERMGGHSVATTFWKKSSLLLPSTTIVKINSANSLWSKLIEKGRQKTLQDLKDQTNSA